jgi:hypothetical protein
MAAGGECYDDMRVLGADEGLQRLIGYELPSADAVRAYANAFHDEGLIQRAKDERPRGAVAYIPAEGELLAGLAEVNVALCRAVAARGKATGATLDHDATIQESHKQQAQAHYMAGRGYQPSCVYWAEQDLVIGDEYRDGNVPAGMDNLPLIRRAISASSATRQASSLWWSKCLPSVGPAAASNCEVGLGSCGSMLSPWPGCWCAALAKARAQAAGQVGAWEPRASRARRRARERHSPAARSPLPAARRPLSTRPTRLPCAMSEPAPGWGGKMAPVRHARGGRRGASAPCARHSRSLPPDLGLPGSLDSYSRVS